MNIWSRFNRVAPPRSPEARAFLKKYEVASRPFIIVSAVLPLFIDSDESRPLGMVVAVVTWLVFVVDFAVQNRMRERYVWSRLGLLDLVIVVLTSPWYLIPGVGGGSVVAVLRMARLARLVVVARGMSRLLERLGRSALIAGLVVGLCSWAALRAERPVNPEFGSFGDALWWGYVTLTTVGYGDIAPVTPTGRIAGAIIMTVGIGLLGVLAGSLASFFRLTPHQIAQDEEHATKDQQDLALGPDPAGADDAHPPGAGPAGDLAELRREVGQLRREIATLSQQLAGHSPSPPPPAPQQPVEDG